MEPLSVDDLREPLEVAHAKSYCVRRDSHYGRTGAKCCADTNPDQPDRWCHWCIVATVLASLPPAPTAAGGHALGCSAGQKVTPPYPCICGKSEETTDG